MNHKKKCLTFKTRLGYLCSKSTRGLKGKWCVINPNDVVKYNNYLSQPNTHKNYYWDYISETNPLGFYYEETPEGLKYSTCSQELNRGYTTSLFGCLIMGVLTKSITDTKAIQHVRQTWNFAHMSDKQILSELAKKLKELLPPENTSNKGIIDSIKDDIDKIPEQDPSAIGKYLKEVLKQSQVMIKANTASKYKGVASPVIDFFINHIPDNVAFEVLKGANFKIEDGGALYNYTRDNLNGYGRFSSHASSVMQIGSTDVFIDTYFHLLCGAINENGSLVSWCQFDGAPMPPGLSTSETFSNIINGGENREKYLQYYLDHFLDSAVYFSLSKSIQMMGGRGYNLAIGKSIHTDNNPIKLPPFNYTVGYLDDTKTSKLNPNLTFNYLNNEFTYAFGKSDMSSLFNESLYGTRGSIQPDVNPIFNQSNPQFAILPQTNFTQNSTSNLQLAMGGKNKKSRLRRKRSLFTNRLAQTFKTRI